MCCYFCQAFVQPHAPLNLSEMEPVDYLRETKGMCMLNPEPVQVNGLHWCHQFRGEPPHPPYRGEKEPQTSIVGLFWIRMWKSGRERDDEYKRRKELEAKLKALRVKVRKMK